jgi:16S rRNA (uracil1498-N3)-methyltransferase
MPRQKLQRLTLDHTQLQEPLQPSTLLPLTFEQKHYLCHVLRLETGAEFIALNGMGHCWLAQVEADGTQARILSEISDRFESDDPEMEICLAIAMPKGNTIESAIRQAAELGVRQILPLWSDRTVVRPNTPLGSQKLERWQRIAQEATELSWQTYVPQIVSPLSFHDFIAEDRPNNQPKLLCVTHDAPHLLAYLNYNYPIDAQIKDDQSKDDQFIRSKSILIATGAEGGWTQPEEAHAIAHGWQPVSLGDRILSAITAPVVALAIIRAALEARPKS